MSYILPVPFEEPLVLPENDGVMNNIRVHTIVGLPGWEDSEEGSAVLDGDNGKTYFANYNRFTGKWTTPAYYLVEDGRPDYVIVKTGKDAPVFRLEYNGLHSS